MTTPPTDAIRWSREKVLERMDNGNKINLARWTPMPIDEWNFEFFLEEIREQNAELQALLDALKEARARNTAYLSIQITHAQIRAQQDARIAELETELAQTKHQVVNKRVQIDAFKRKHHHRNEPFQ